MISAALSHMAHQLNQQLRINFQLGEEVAVVSNLVELDIEKDTVPYRPGNGARGLDDRLLQNNAPLFLNLYVMVSANFGAGNYTEALKYISQAVAFFQMKPVLDQRNSPGLDRRIDRLVLDIENLPIPDLNNLWSLLGGRYLPSMFYKVRMVTVDAGAISGQLPFITDLQPVLKG